MNNITDEDVYIISDLHLNVNNLKIAEIFKNFLEKISAPTNILFILGDFFDYWIGDDHLDEFHHKITNYLKQATKTGLKIYFMHGNRDFLIGTTFAKAAGIKIIKDPCYIKIVNKKIILAHGDLMCTDDKSYQIYRKFITKNKILQFLFTKLPLAIRQKTAKNIMSRSREKNYKHPNIDVTHRGIDKYRKNCNIVIHGHTHKIGIHHEKNYTRYVLGDWHTTGNYIKISKGDISLIRKIET